MERRFVVRDFIIIFRNERHMRPRFGGGKIASCTTVMTSEIALSAADLRGA